MPCDEPFVGGYNYDAAGNLPSTGSAYNLVSMTWDAENRISSANGAVYVYDAEGNRVQKQGVSITETVYFGGRPVARYDGGGWTDLIYGPTGLLAEVPGTENAEPVFHLTDHLGTQVGSVNSTGILTNPLDYTPWGQIFSGSTNDPYFFTGKERDAESGLDYFGARYMGSSMGRFMSPDPSGLSYANPNDPQSFNLYAYVGNHPLTYVDPYGLNWFTTAPCSNTQYAGLSLLGKVGNFVSNLFANCGGGGGSDDTNDRGPGGGGGAGINIPAYTRKQFQTVVRQAQQNFPKRCDQVFKKAVPGYTKSKFFDALASGPLQQHPDDVFTDANGRHVDTSATTAGQGSIGPNSNRTISLWRPFYSGGYETEQSRPFVLIHEETHRFTGFGDFGSNGFPAKFGDQGFGGGSNSGGFTDWLQGGCPND